MFIKALGLVHFANTEVFLDMSTYSEIIEKYVSIFVPENALEELRKDIERAREARRLLLFLRPAIFGLGKDSSLTAQGTSWTTFLLR